jgi:hypothetical protein
MNTYPLIGKTWHDPAQGYLKTIGSFGTRQ